MSVVGIDVGNLNSYIGIARQGGIEVITNDYSLHATPSCVSFGSKNRSLGVAARQQVNTNIKNTILNFKHLVGRKFSDPIAQQFIPFVPCQVVQLPNDDIGFKVSYLDQQQVFTPEQVLAALLTKLKLTVEANVEKTTKVYDVVLGIPGYFTDVQRRAVLAAVQTAQLNPLRVINESTAIALAYGIYKQDLPADTEKPRHVLFLDVGHSCTQASIVAYHKGKLQMIGSSFDLSVGGIWLDDLIREHFRKEMQEKYKIDPKTNARAWLRLLDESERVKKQMSANRTPIPLNIECFMEDKDVSSKMQRDDFEALAAPLFDRVRKLIRNLLQESGTNAQDMESVEIVGGSSRIPMIRQIVQEIFGYEPKTTMNQDEAVARGAAMQCAILSPSFRVRDFSVKDAQPFRIKLTWGGNGGQEGGESDVFVERDEFPFSKLLTFYRNEPFQLDAGYSLPNTVPHTTRQIGSWRISGVTPSPDGESRKVKVKVRVNPNGLFSVCSATMYETQTVVVQEEPEAAKMDVDMEGKAPEAQEEAAAPAEEKATQEPKTKTKSVPIELKVEESIPVVFNLAHFSKIEEDMRAADLAEKTKADAKNSVEEYVYEMREKLSDSFAEFVKEADADAFRSLLSSTEDWLYDEGEDAETSVYETRLTELRKYGEPIVERFREFEGRQPSFDLFDQSILRARKAYEEYAAGGPAHAHIESKDMEKVINAIEEKKKWLDEARHKTDKRPKTDVPAVWVNEIKQQHASFENIVTPILTKKAAPKKEDPPAKKEEAKKGETEANAEPEKASGDMEVD